MKTHTNKLLKFLLLLFVIATASCSTLSDKYLQFNIRIATHPGVVAGLKFVDGWTTEAGYAYGPEQVGIIVANQLAQSGWHDITVLVELASRGNAQADFPASLNMWRISIYR